MSAEWILFWASIDMISNSKITEYVPDTVLRTLELLSHLVLVKALISESVTD